MSFDSGVVTGDDEEGPSTVSCRDSYPVGHDYEEVYMSKTELKPTLYERLSRKGHYAEVKKAKVQVKGESSSEVNNNENNNKFLYIAHFTQKRLNALCISALVHHSFSAP